MERFTLLFMPVIKHDISAIIAEIKKGHNCTSCNNKEAYPINKETIQNGAFMVTQAKEFSQLKGFINDFYANKDIDFILLIDDQKDIAYIYKGTGTLSELKKNKLSMAIKAYEHGIKKESFFCTIENVRTIMPMANNSMN